MIYKEITGRLGNQMFQYATLKCFQKKYYPTDDICLNFEKLKKFGTEKDGFEDSLKYFNVSEYQNVSNINISLIQKIILFLYKLKFYKIYYLNKKNNMKKIYKFEQKYQRKFNKYGLYLMFNGYVDFQKTKYNIKYFNGYFESPKYFNEIRDELLQEFTPKNDKLKKNENLYKIIENENSICISVRVGDFLSPQFKSEFYICNPTYFKNAIKVAEEKIENPRFIVFSDDVEWCKKNLGLPKNTLYETGNDPIWEKIRLMYSCKNFIISNSTFSWWAQYLSRNEKKIVIAPKKWRNISYKNEKNDIYQDNWICI